MSDSFQPHGLQNSRLPCPSPTPRACSNSCPPSRWCHPTISSSVVPFSAFNLSQHQDLFKWVGSSHQVAKVLEFQLQRQSFQWIFRTDFFNFRQWEKKEGFLSIPLHSPLVLFSPQSFSTFSWVSKFLFCYLTPTLSGGAYFSRLCVCMWSCSVMSDSATPWTATCHSYLSITNSQSLLKLMSIELVMPSNHLILCHPLLCSSSIFPSNRVFSNALVTHQVAKALEFQLWHQSFQWIFRTDFL